MSVPISNVSRRQVYAPSGAGGAGPYAFTFEILANTDIAVYKDDTLLTLTTHYTVIINANGTGSVTITAAGLALSPTSPTQYAIVGNRTIARSSDFTTGGDFFANTLNDELDQQTIFAQQNAEGIQRALSAPQTDPTSINMTLPRASVRAGKYLSFDGSGNPEAAEDRTEVAAVYAIRDEIVAVATIDDQVVAVAGNATNINTVAGSIANVNSVGGSIASVNTVAGELGAGQDVTVVAANLNGTDTIGTVAGSITNVNNVGGSIANVNTVAGSISNVNTNATNIANINENAANIEAIQNASGYATAALASATYANSQAESAAASAAAASAVALGSEPVRPAIRPSLLLDFANTKQLDPRITFTRASTATYYGSQTAKAEENLILQSQDFTTTWTQSNAVRTANTTTAPDGSTTADTLTDDTTNGGHIVNQSPVLIAGAVYTFSVFLKASTNNFAVVTLTNPTTVENGISAVVDLTTGVITQTDSGTNATAGVFYSESVGNGWHRVVITGSSVAGFTRAEVGLAPLGVGNTFSSSQRVAYIGLGTSVFAWGAQLEQRSTATAYTPTTTQAITNYIPQLLTAASGVARFDHNPVTGESLGLEIEEQRTNLLTYSDQFSDAAWTKTRASITANQIVSPDGTINADKLVEDTTATATHQIERTVSYTSGTTYTRSLYVKAAERTGIRIRFPASAFTNALDADFDLAAVAISATGGVSASITPVGNGWYRCTSTATATTTASGSELSGLIISGNNPTYTGDGYSGIYIWGAQLEAGAFVTSYIPTVASQVTRSADAAVMTGTNFSSWYNQAQGTFYSDFAFTGLTGIAGQRVVIADDGTTSNYIGTLSSSTSGMQNPIVRNGTSEATLSTPSTTFIANSFNKISVGFKNNDSIAAANNVLGTADTVCLLPLNLTALRFGASSTSSTSSVLIRKFAYYPLRVTNAQLQAMTTV